MEPLIIDTDIGTDVDDVLAIFYAIRSGMDVKLITTVHGDTHKRAKVARKLTDLLEVDIPIHAGEEKPIKQPHVFWYGDEGKGFVEDKERLDIRDNAIEAIAETVYDNRNNISIAGIAPLTNIALAFERYPDLPDLVNRIYLMGNAIITPDNFYLNYRAHNFKVDPEAADIVFEADVDKTIVTTEVAKKSCLTGDDIQSFEESGVDVYQRIAKAARNWMHKVNYDVLYLYDPLTVSHHTDDFTSRKSYRNTSITADLEIDFRKKLLEVIGKENGI